MAAAIELAGVRKNHQGLRPLRIQSLSVDEGERVSLAGLDMGAASALVDLISAAVLPDEGEVRVMGRSTADVVSADSWLASLDRFDPCRANVPGPDDRMYLVAAFQSQRAQMANTVRVETRTSVVVGIEVGEETRAHPERRSGRARARRPSAACISSSTAN